MTRARVERRVVRKGGRIRFKRVLKPKTESLNTGISDFQEDKQLPTLHEEVLFQILSWLPVISLLRFKCVCKSWRKLITSDQEFIDLQHDRSVQSDRYSLIDAHHDHFFDVHSPVDFKSPIRPQRFEVPYDSFPPSSYLFRVEEEIELTRASSCNGLVCLTSRSLYPPNALLILNPSTRSFKLLPEPPQHFPDLQSYWTATGFGYSSLTREYKVIRFECNTDLRFIEELVSVDILTVGSKAWRPIHNFPVEMKSEFYNRTVLFNQSLHWFKQRTDDLEISPTIVTFDVETEEFSKLPLPRELDDRSYDRKATHLCVLNGSLGMYRNFRATTEVWIMNEYGVQESWTRLCAIMHPWDSYFSCKLVSSLPNGEILLLTNERQVVYDPKRRMHRNIKVKGFKHCNAIDYVESLAWFNED